MLVLGSVEEFMLVLGSVEEFGVMKNH